MKNTRTPETIDIACIVVPGRGQASRVRARDIEDVSAARELPLVQGSLNLISEQPLYLRMEQAFFSVDNHAYWDAKLDGVPVILNRWRGCPAHVFEVFSDRHLRSALSLTDRSRVTLSIPGQTVDISRSRSLCNRLIWYGIWRGREEFFYAGEKYVRLLRHRFVHPYVARGFQ